MFSSNRPAAISMDGEDDFTLNLGGMSAFGSLTAYESKHISLPPAKIAAPVVKASVVIAPAPATSSIQGATTSRQATASATDKASNLSNRGFTGQKRARDVPETSGIKGSESVSQLENGLHLRKLPSAHHEASSGDSDAEEAKAAAGDSKHVPRGQGGHLRMKTPAVVVPASVLHASKPGKLTAIAVDDKVEDGTDTFEGLGVDERLIRKLLADREALIKPVPVVPDKAAAKPIQSTATSGVVRGHLKEGFGLFRPTRVQRMTIPRALRRESLFIRSETGSGKTLAYMLPIVQCILATIDAGKSSFGRDTGTLALIIGPTRELCTQIFTVTSRLLQSFPAIIPGLIIGGEKRKSEKARLRKGVHILIATPGRLLDHLRTTTSFQCSNLQSLVLDEADRLLDMGFGHQIKEIVALLRGKASEAKRTHAWQSYLISATLTKSLKQLAVEIIDPTQVIGLLDASMAATDDSSDEEESSEVVKYSAPTTLLQQYVIVPLKWRLVTILGAIYQTISGKKAGCKIIVFVSTTASVDFHFQLLRILLPHWTQKNDASVFRLHGNMPQSDRVTSFRGFAETDFGILIATDIASRGLDLPAVDVIIQADPPSDTAEYVHRVGRTARRGENGRAILMLQPHENEYADVLLAAGLNVAAASTATMLESLGKATFPETLFLSRATAAEDDMPVKAQHLRKAATRATSAAERAEMNAALWQFLSEEAVLRIPLAPSVTAVATESPEGDSTPSSSFLELARSAFISFVRAYAAHEKSVRHIFHPRALHLGHGAKAFGLRETPTAAVHISRKHAEKEDKKKEAKKTGPGSSNKLKVNPLSFGSREDRYGAGSEARAVKRQRKSVTEYDA
jgi:ATP-dependent RNA helicase DDX31/DBP7